MVDSFGYEIAARTIWMEARGEGPAGELDVAWVLCNRARVWHQTLAQVCLAAYQFSSWNAGDQNRRSMSKLAMDDAGLVIARQALDAALAPGAVDPTAGATHYVNLSIAQPSWIKGATLTLTQGHHSFYKDVT